MLYIRADGNSEIGTGHIMRCLSIANAVRQSGGDCIFITADKSLESLLAEQGFQIICLDSVWNDLDKETVKMERLIAERKIVRLLIDSYFVTSDYLNRLRSLTRIAYIDDLDVFRYPCDLLINYNIYAGKFNYPVRYPDTMLLLGCKYVPLREEFQDLPAREIHSSAKSVLITTGGGDPYNVAGKLTERLKRDTSLCELNIHIVAGLFNSNLPLLRSLEENFPSVMIHRNVRHMSALMISCDIAISAGGSTLYELCSCGIPSTIFAWANNQLDAVATFSEGYMLGAGDYREDKAACLDKLVANIVRLSEDFSLRREVSANCRALVDGRGAERVAVALSEIT